MQGRATRCLDSRYHRATASAEAATGYYWGEPKLRPWVERILAEARQDGNERLEQLAERFLRVVTKSRRSD
jgi:hypothetical protein